MKMGPGRTRLPGNMAAVLWRNVIYKLNIIGDINM
jgi:hypothetical protein